MRVCACVHACACARVRVRACVCCNLLQVGEGCQDDLDLADVVLHAHGLGRLVGQAQVQHHALQKGGGVEKMGMSRFAAGRGRKKSGRGK